MSYRACVNCFTPLPDDSVCPKCGFDNASYRPMSHHLSPGTIIMDRYVVGKAMGEGGFGITYVGFDTILERKVAIKEYYPEGMAMRDSSQSAFIDCFSSESSLARYSAGIIKCMNEAESLAQLDDTPGIVRVLDHFLENQTAYIIMEFAEGVTLASYLNNLPQKPDYRYALQLLDPISKALTEVHSRGFVHRDISPDNIMIDENGRAKLLDFGAVKMVSEEGSTTETPIIKRGFSPMEMYSTKGKIGPWSDVYSFCATVYYILTGTTVPEPMDRVEEAHENSIRDTLLSILSPSQTAALLKGISCHYKERYQSIAAMSSALNACKNDVPLCPEQDNPTPSSAKKPVDTTQPPAKDSPAHTSKEEEKRTAQTAPNKTPGPDPVVPDKPISNKTENENKDEIIPIKRTDSKKQKKAIFAAVAVFSVAAILITFFILRSIGNHSGNPPSVSEKTAEVMTSTDVTQNTGSRILMAYDFDNGASIFGSTDYKKSDIVSVEFLDSLSGMPSSGAWDVSAEQDGSVYAWVASTSNGYTLTIAADGGIIANEDCRYLFSGPTHKDMETQVDKYIHLQSINFNNAFDTSGTTKMRGMFAGCESLQHLDLSGFNTAKVTDMRGLFSQCQSLQAIDLSGFNTAAVTHMDRMFNRCSALQTLDLSSFNTSKTINMSDMFCGCESLQTIELGSFNTAKVTKMSQMFINCKSLQSLDLHSFNTSKTVTMERMFHGCESLQELDLSGFDTTHVKDMCRMFYNCHSLKTVDLSSFSTSEVENMTEMFNGCQSLQTLDLSGFNTAKVTDMALMFYNCSSLQALDLRSFNTAAVTKMNLMFYGCTALKTLDVSSFDTSATTEMGGMFYGCNSLGTLDLRSFSSQSVKKYGEMLYDTSCQVLVDSSKFTIPIDQ